jgi:hypothetical protein
MSKVVTGMSESGLQPTTPNEGGVSPDCTIIRFGMNSVRKRYWTREFFNTYLDRLEGALCNIDHPTIVDEQVRPEGSLRTVAAVAENIRIVDDAVIGDLRYLSNPAGQEARALFSDEAVRRRAGLSVRFPGRAKVERRKIDNTWVQVPLELLDNIPATVDFTTVPTAGGAVTPIQEGGIDLMELTDVTLEELTEANPALVKAIEDRALAAAAENADDDAEDEETDPETTTTEDPATESALRTELGQMRASTVVERVLRESNLPAEIADLVLEDFSGAECSATQESDFRTRVGRRIERYRKLYGAGFTPGGADDAGAGGSTSKDPISIVKGAAEAFRIPMSEE